MVPLRLCGVQLIRIKSRKLAGLVKSRKLAGLVSLAGIFKNCGHNFQAFSLAETLKTNTL